MNAVAGKAKDLFVAALKLPPDQWNGYLAETCGADEALHHRVRNLLWAHEQAGSFLEPATPVAPTFDYEPLTEQPGTVIGPYKLLEQIGEGGFGVVFLAEQQEPIRRKVALKILKPGMDSRQIVARFEAERQALAIMDHPNIARVFDGGVVGQASSLPEQRQAGSLPHGGRPYFVMELVNGIPLTEFSDQNHLTVRQRLDLFLAVCQAVQHAHQKGIIHRDLKPSNVLVSRHDTTPMVKVIDFGVAKAVGQELADKTLFTDFAYMIGTPLYMSPEQAGMSDLDVDTRSDIYSLGILLYELLTGSTPFDKDRFKKANYDEIRRIIREEEPPKPSTRLSELKETLPSISVQRQMEPAKLTKLVRGELDWIVMKCLEKNRNRRYETASSLAMDLQRYLEGEPVLAHPPSTTYRLWKFVKRNRGRVIGLSIVTASMFLGLLAVILVLFISNERISHEKKLAAQERDRALKNRNAMVMAVFEVLGPLASEEWRTDPKLSKVRAKMLDHAVLRFQYMLQQDRDDPRFRRETGCAFHTVALIYEGFYEREKSIAAYGVSLALLEALPDDQRQDAYVQHTIATNYYNLGHALILVDRPDEARTAFQKAITVSLHNAQSFPEYRSFNMAAWILVGCPFPDVRGDPAVAIAMAHKAVQLKPDVQDSWNTLGIAYYRANQLHDAYKALEESRRLHPLGGEGFIWLYLAMVEWGRGNKDEAQRWFQQTVNWLSQTRDGAHPVELHNIVRETATKLGVSVPKVP